MISKGVRAICVRDVHLDDDEIRIIVEIYFFNMLILQIDFIIREKDTQPM